MTPYASVIFFDEEGGVNQLDFEGPEATETWLSALTLRNKKQGRNGEEKMSEV